MPSNKRRAGEHPASFPALATPSGLAVFARKSLAMTLSIVLAAQPLLVQAQEIRADQAAGATNQPQIGASSNGVPLIDIVTPNAAGLSHNKYGEFNVGPGGVILNNSNQDLLRSQLGGLVQGNANLRSSGPARVILNEVTGSNRSLLQGAVEVHGRAADVVIANPNGLTCNGCGFINTPRVTLSTGTPELGADGSLSGLRVEGADVRIGANGADLGSVDIFDIVSRKIAVDGPVRAGGALNLIAGRNSYAYRSGLITPLASDGGEPALAIDSSLLGGMYAGSIKVISTDTGAGVNMSGQMAANTGAMTLSADGKLTLGKAQAKRAITARSVKEAVRVESTLFSDEAVVLEGLTAIELADRALVVARADVTLKGQTVSLGADALAASGSDSNGQQTATGTLRVDASLIDAGRGQLAGGGLLSIKAGTIDLSRGADNGRDTLRSLSGISIEADRIDALNGRVTAGGDLSVTSTNTLALTGGRYVSGAALLVQAASLTSGASLAATTTARLETLTGDLTQSGDVAGNGATTLSSAGDIVNSGRVVSKNTMTLSADGDVLVSGRLVSESALTLAGRDGGAAGHITVQSDALINGGNGLAFRAASLTNAGSIRAADGALLAELAGNLSNTGLLYSGTSSTYRLDGSFTNVNADILAGTDLTVAGLGGARAGALDNRSGTIEAVAGNMSLDVASLTNRRDGLTATVGTTSQTAASGATTTTVVTRRETATANGPASQLLAGGDLTIGTGALVNSYSQIAANGDIDITAGSVLNEGRDLIETVETTAVTQHSERYCARRIFGACINHRTRYWTTTDSHATSRTYDSVFGTIEAGGSLNANVTGYLTNNAVRGQAGQVGLSSGNRALTAADAASASSARELAGLSSLNVSVDALLGRRATFQTALSPNMPFLIETRSEFIDPGKFLGSDYFLSRIGGYDPNVPLKRLGDAYVEYRLIRDQIFNLTGSRALGSELDAYQLMQALYDNAVDAQRNLGLSFGIALTPSQVAALRQDIVWLEKQTVQGREVLVPRLYVAASTLANTSLANTSLAGAQIRAGQATIETAALVNSGAISTAGNLGIDTSAALFNDGGSLFAGADIVIDAGSMFSNRSGTVLGGTVTIEADTIVNDTARVRDVYANGFADRVQQAARIEARQDLLLKASGSIVSEGGRFAAGDDMLLDAGASIEITALELERSRDDAIKGGYDRAYALTNTLAQLRAGGNLTLDAAEDLTLRGANLSAGRDVSVQADGDVTIASVQDRQSRDLKLDIKTGGLLGTETNIRRQASSVETQATTVEAGEDLTVRSLTGDVTLRAPRIVSGGETLLQADEGQVALLTETDQSFEQTFKREEDLFWWNERDQGRAEETIRHVEIEAGGGLRIDAGNGIVIEYHKTGSLEASLDQLAQSPGLAWVGELRNDPALAAQVDWQAVDAQFQAWDYKSQGLTEAGAALVTLVATALTAGTGGFTATLSSSLATSLGIESAAMQVALNAGVQSLVNKTVVALVNNQGDLGAALKELGSSGNIRSLISTMVTAGLTSQMLSMANIPEIGAGGDFGQNLAYEAQRNLIKAAIRAGVGITIDGEDPGKALVGALRLAAADTIGAVFANQIGDYAAFNGIKDGDIQKVVLHAMAGCAAGAIGSGNCLAGGIGSGLGELLGKPLSQAVPDPARQTALLSLIAGVAAALANGSAQAINASANAAATTHQYNYLNHEELQAALANRKQLERCTQGGATCSQDELTAIISKDAAFIAASQANTGALLQICLAAPGSQACAARIADLKSFAARLESERDNGLVFADPMSSAGGFSVKRSIFDYDLLLARSLTSGSKPADIAIQDFVIGMSKREGAVNGFLSAVGVVGGVGVCASGVGTLACAAGALGALASGNHLYGDVQQALTGNEARTVLVQALTAQGLSTAEAKAYQAYIDAGVVVVSLGVVGGQAVYRFAVNSAKVSAADRTALAALEQKSVGGGVGNGVPERIVVRTSSAGASVVEIHGREMSSHASRQATTRGISNENIATAMDQKSFSYVQNGQTLQGYHDPVSNTFVGVGDRITTVINPRNPENYLNNLMRRQ